MTTARVARHIWVSFELPGIHCYPDAPEEVAYLRNPHRHMFEFNVTIGVTHNERDIEFHMFKNWMVSLYDKGVLQLDAQSCETIAENLVNKITAKYPGRDVTVDVSEDGECGSTITYVPVGALNVTC